MDVINRTHMITDGQTLISSDGSFELGFFSPASSKNRYVGIWYKKITAFTVVWVANRDNPLTNTSGAVLKVTEPGILALLNGSNSMIWSSNMSGVARNPVAQLLDSGNLVVKEANDDYSEKYLWQSFDYPTDTFLPGMKLGWNFVTGYETYITAWKSNEDSGMGDYAYHLDPTGYPQAVLRRRSVELFRSGPWNGLGFSGLPSLKNNSIYTFELVLNENEAYYHYELLNKSVFSRATMDCISDGFQKYSDIKLPDTKYSRFNASITLGECRVACVKDCNCSAYTNSDKRGGSGCLLWFGDLVDIKVVYGAGQDLYIRMASSEVEEEKFKQSRDLLLRCDGVCTYSQFYYIIHDSHVIEGHEEGREKDLELPTFDFLKVAQATNGFSVSNKVGEGGFGPVYRGKLEDGKEIAVKRLSRTSLQGLDEFKNEVICIAKLQHRNLVRLLGCCIQGEEKMLIYEYMPNGSLDLILFDQKRNVLLDWPKRFHIINGVARGLLYLHQDSRLRIIHRDLKASNVLLDSDMNPKISDFGTARSFGGNETSAKTRRVVGTYGYMSPEYAVDGLFSVKSDVFSFGVLVLEIVSGKRNRGFSHSEHHLNLLGHAWTLHKEERSLEIVDTSPGDSFDLSEVLRSIHVGLLCVQKKPEDRPSMSSVVLMLGNQGVFPPANQPGFYTERETFIADESTTTNAANSTNEVTETLLEGR
ncbi:UNVERIFIED_CONTAM: G-type lectin S-receptor-like serine/threonine-protein kinase [Sesamum radiatum]|uniref:Receptor-like serine/threonine-protein kinase n=1 Tax=Sesamum radiatum TaxID=300843 RepID=A0AAW2T3I6_SESRA